MYCLTSYDSPIGLLTLGSDGKHLTGLWIQGQKYFGGCLLYTSNVNWYFRLRRLLFVFFLLVVMVLPFYVPTQSRHNRKYAGTIDFKGFF